MTDARLRTALRPAAADGPADAHLLDRFLASGDESAFELLVWRHSASVLAVCRRVLRHNQDAEDAFQATFLALARKARTVARRGAVGGWLYAVAYRVAVRARTRAARRPAPGPLPPDVPARSATPAAGWDEVAAVVVEEIARLPERYRAAFALCHFEGLTLAEAARRLGCPRATVGTRVARARERLKRRLVARGVGPAAAVLAVGVAAPPARPAGELVAAVVRHARAGGPPAAVVVQDLTEGVIRNMALHKLTAGLTATVMVLAFAAGGVGLVVQAADPPAAPAAPTGPPPGPVERLTVPGWGAGIDPDGDCQFTVGKGSLTIAVPGSDHVLGVERKKMNAPRVLQEVGGDFIVQVRVRGGFPTAGVTTVRDRLPHFAAGLLVYADDKTYVRLERAELFADGAARHYPCWELRRAGEAVRKGTTDDGVLDPAAPVWLRLERRGARLFGSHSADGVAWAALRPLTCTLPPTVRVGVSAGTNTTTPFAATFDGLQLFRSVAGGPPADDDTGLSRAVKTRRLVEAAEKLQLRKTPDPIVVEGVEKLKSRRLPDPNGP